MKFSNFSKLISILFLMISFFSSKTLANYEKVFFDFSIDLVNGKSIDLKDFLNFNFQSSEVILKTDLLIGLF